MKRLILILAMAAPLILTACRTPQGGTVEVIESDEGTGRPLTFRERHALLPPPEFPPP